MAWTIQLKSSHLPAYDHWYLDGHFLLIVWQCWGMAAGGGEIQAEVHYVSQTMWHLNMLPSGMPSLKDINLDELDSFPLNSGARRKKGVPMVHKTMPMAHLSNLTILPILQQQQNYR